MADKLSIKSYLTLPKPRDKIPRLGFGVYRSPESVCEASVTEALKAGYRQIDTAQYYRNETQVGIALAKSGIAREDVFLTTKVLSSAGSVEKTLDKCRDSVAKLDPRPNGYVDLFLVHNPNAGSAVRRELWTALERLQAEGKTRAIGVSNYGIGHIEEMKAFATASWPPAVNQIELHPWCQQPEIVDYCREQGIVVQAYSPLTRMNRAYEPVLQEIAEKYGKKTTQVMIRYCLQKQWAPLVKSDTPSRIVENCDVFDFELTIEDMKVLDDQNEGPEGAQVQSVINDV